jgi:hypothetical protein
VRQSTSFQGSKSFPNCGHSSGGIGTSCIDQSRSLHSYSCPPARGRKVDGGNIEIVAGAKRLEAIRRLSDSGHSVPLLVELVDMDDDVALKNAEITIRAKGSGLNRCRRPRYANGETAISCARPRKGP